ncbi:hypothetical protein OS493_018970 [Desmophyllum pertusum]|uniref:Uncharacterized protein n=1 Tax=Desmophyllum pertusum TaxID=174260 RepID=A0A9X0CSE0_9CNID|nr:hypothetical protein OS493_018970 [Desmophyllum pertusum]
MVRRKPRWDIFYPMIMNDNSATTHKYKDNATPVLLFVHGGYWQAGSRKIYSFIGAKIHQFHKPCMVCFLISGVFDVVPCVNTFVNDAMKLDEESAARLSPQRILMKTSPTFSCPVLVAVEEHGSPEFTRQSKEFVEILKSHGGTEFFS